MIPLLLTEMPVATTSPHGATAPVLDADFSFSAFVEEEIIVADEADEDLEKTAEETEVHTADDAPRELQGVDSYIEPPKTPLPHVAHTAFVQNAQASHEKDRAATSLPPRALLQEQRAAEPKHPVPLISDPAKVQVPGTKKQDARVIAPTRTVGLPIATQQSDLAVKADEAAQIVRTALGGLMESTTPQRPSKRQDVEVDHKPIHRLPVAPKSLASSAAIAIPVEVQPALVPSEKLELDPIAAVSSERHAAQPLPLTQVPTAQVETVRQVASQLAGAMLDRTGRPTEIALNPEELGRVRLTISAVDTAITLNISAERQETTDLLRRHIDALAQEFKELGYDDISFSFGKRDGSSETEVDRPMRASDLSGDDEDNVTRSPTMMASASSLDIKL